MTKFILSYSMKKEQKISIISIQQMWSQELFYWYLYVC